MRLNKYIAESGFCSRRKADELISQNRVTVNKDTAKLGMEVQDSDIVRIDGEKIKLDTSYEYYLFYKPKKVICTNSDNFSRRLAVDFIKSKKRLFHKLKFDFKIQLSNQKLQHHNTFDDCYFFINADNLVCIQYKTINRNRSVFSCGTFFVG